MKRLMLLSALSLAGCYTEDSPQPKGVGSFQVEVRGVYFPAGSRNALAVVNACAAQYNNSQAQVPAEVRGTADCRYVMPTGPVDIELGITALDVKGQPLEAFNGPVSFRSVPGDLAGSYNYRWTNLTNGQGTGTVRVAHLYGEARMWVQDEPVEVDYADGEVAAGELPEEPSVRTYATGLSKPLMFEEPTIASVQTPVGREQLTAFRGQFMRIGRNPEAGPVLRQNCPEGDPNNGQPVTLLVTGTDPGGFFVTDLTACRVRESSLPDANIQTPEPDGYNPGRFHGMYIYNYSFPEGLDPGDLLWTLAGSVQEFTATTQLTFPSWTIREKVRLLPQSEWDKYLKLAPPTEINGRLCGYSGSPYVTDPLCGYSYTNFKMESLESTLVKVRRVKFPSVFHSCDTNGDNEVPFFCPNTREGTWTFCGTDDPAPAERQCNIDCTMGIGQFAGTVCSERTTFEGFGQFVVEMNPTGAGEGGLDNSVPARIERVTAAVSATPDTVTWARSGGTGYGTGQRIHIWCDKAATLRFGGTSVPGASSEVALAARTVLPHTMVSGETYVWASVQNRDGGAVTCQVAPDVRTRINVVTKDAVPDLKPDCREDDPDAERARQCRFLRGATFDIVGHLRQVSAARPRWVVLPRNQDDLCCHPGAGMECPSPIQACAD